MPTPVSDRLGPAELIASLLIIGVFILHTLGHEPWHLEILFAIVTYYFGFKHGKNGAGQNLEP